MKTIITLSMLSIVAFSCKKDVIEEPVPVPVPATNNNPFFSGAVNGTSFSSTMHMDGNGYGYTALPEPGNDFITIDYYASFSIDPVNSSEPNKNITMGITGLGYTMSTYNEQAFQSSIAGSPLTFFESGSGAAGYEFTYADNQGNFWSSRYGDQTGSVITITTNQAATPSGNVARRLLKGTTSCKLYKEQTGEMITVTNGSFRAYLYEYDM